MPSPRRPSPLRVAAPWCRLAAGFGLLLLAGPPAPGQDLRIDGVVPGGIRSVATERWGTYDFSVTNPTDTDRRARVLVLYDGQPNLQYGRDLWVPAHSTRSAWLLVGPAAAQDRRTLREIQFQLHDVTDGGDRLVPPSGSEKVRSRLVRYRKDEPSTAVLLDEDPPAEAPPGQLPQPESRRDEVLKLVRTFRQVHRRPEDQRPRLSENLEEVSAGFLLPTVEAFDGIQQFVLASDRLPRDPAGIQALRRWVEHGGTLWVMLDQVDVDALAPLLGDALNFEIVDRVSLTRFKVDVQATGQVIREAPLQEYERPVELVRVLLPAGERPPHTINGWPVWFTRRMGRGKVVFTALGPRGWYRDRDFREPSPYEHFPALPIEREHFKLLADELDPGPDKDPIRLDAFRPPLTEQIGYAIVNRGTVAAVFGSFLALMLGLGLVLRRSRRPELLGWLGPAAALGATAVFLVLGLSSRRAVPPTVAVAQVVDAVPGTDEAAVHGLLAVYRPDSGAAEVGAAQGGFIDPEPDLLTGSEGLNRRLIVTDLGAWHWENLDLPAGVRWAAFRATAPSAEPLRAVARFGPNGLEGRLVAGDFRHLADALLAPAGGRNLAVRLRDDGTFAAGSTDVLPADQFLASAVLTDVQQRRRELYREFLKRPGAGPLEGRNLLFAWADPVPLHFTLGPEPRTVGTALLIVPLRLEHAPPGTEVTVPGPFVPYRRMMPIGKTLVPTKMPREARIRMDLHLRFQLPAEVLPLHVERAVLKARINAPSRKVTITAPAGGGPVTLREVQSPTGLIRVDLNEGRFLQPDVAGGLSLDLNVSDFLAGGAEARQGDDKWTIEFLELEVAGRTAPEK
jgi:hypothetical protein